jgi:hypothetical protein
VTVIVANNLGRSASNRRTVVLTFTREPRGKAKSERIVVGRRHQGVWAIKEALSSEYVLPETLPPASGAHTSTTDSWARVSHGRQVHCVPLKISEGSS